VFDTAFHHTMPSFATAYGGPSSWLERGLRRYGFHGISHERAAQQAALQLGQPVDGVRLVTCHLGGGCSITAVDRGRSVDTTMGFTPLDGLVMATRAGSVDPGLLVHLLRTGTSVDELDHLLEHASGLLGLSGVSADLRVVMAARDAGDEQARLAVDVFVHRVTTGVGAMIGALGRPDAIVFTGGIGEGSAEVRDRVAERFSWTGAPTLVVAAHEEVAIASAARAAIATR
jgi:acetate kinase